LTNPDLAVCGNYSLFTIYFFLKLECALYLKPSLFENNNKLQLICGIRKGFGDRTNKTDDKNFLSKNNTYAIYKLTIQKPYLLYSYGYFYNPFNSRFMEDIAFNGLSSLILKSRKLGNYYLRFGHYKEVKDINPDFNDAFNKEVIDNLKDNPITPIYGNFNFVLLS
jgi:hypothetical protein